MAAKKKATKKTTAKKGGAKKKRPVWVSVLKWTAIGIGAREVYLALSVRRNRRRDIFNLAQFQAQQTQKPLIVVGDPDGGLVNRFIGRDYDCGALCIDRTGCLECLTYRQGRLEDLLPEMGTNSAVIFISDQLERVENIDKVLSELDRVSGGDLYVSTVDPWTITSLFYPGAKRQFKRAPPDDTGFEWRTWWWTAKKSPNRAYQLTSGQP